MSSLNLNLVYWKKNWEIEIYLFSLCKQGCQKTWKFLKILDFDNLGKKTGVWEILKKHSIEF